MIDASIALAVIEKSIINHHSYIKMFCPSIRSTASSSHRIVASSSRKTFNPTYIPRRRLHQNQGHSHSHDPYPEFKPPPISTRLKPLIPFFIYWCAITSLAVHLLRNRTSSREELDKCKAQISVLSGLITRLKKWEVISGDEIQRELEMVGLRERVLTKEEIEGGDVGWFKAIFGRRGVSDTDSDGYDKEEAEEDAVAAWTRGVSLTEVMVNISMMLTSSG